jgi:hypothetical protein
MSIKHCVGIFNRLIGSNIRISKFYILLTVHHVMILGKWPTWRTILFYIFIFIFNSLCVSSTSRSSWGETNCVHTTSGNCHSVSTQSDSYQRLYWHNLSLLMMSAMCLKHVELKIKINTQKRIVHHVDHLPGINKNFSKLPTTWFFPPVSVINIAVNVTE